MPPALIPALVGLALGGALGLAAGWAALAPAPDGPAVALARGVDSAAASHSPDDWKTASAALEDHLWATRGLHIARAVFVLAPASGFGIFDPRPSNVFAPGEPVLIYAEPRGYGYGDRGEGIAETGFDIDLRVLDKAGTELGSYPGIVQLGFATRSRNREFMANLRYDLAGLAPGDYRLETTFRDRHGPGVARVTSEITIAAP